MQMMRLRLRGRRLYSRRQKLLLRVAPLRSKAESALERFQEVILSASAIEEQPDHQQQLAAWMPSPAAMQSTLTASTSGHREAAAASDTINETFDASVITSTLDVIVSALAQADEICSVQDRLFAAKETEWSINRTQFSESVRQCELVSSELRSIANLVSSAESKHQEALEAMKQELSLWQEQLGEAVQPDHAHERLAELERRDQSSHELRSRLDRSVSFIEETAEQLKENEKLAQAAQLETLELSIHLESHRKQLAEKQKQLFEWTGGTGAVELMALAEQELACCETCCSSPNKPMIRRRPH